MPPQVMQENSSGLQIRRVEPQQTLSALSGACSPASAEPGLLAGLKTIADRGERRSRARSLGIPPVSRSAAPASFTIAGLVGNLVAQLYSGCGRTEPSPSSSSPKIFGRHLPQPIDLALRISAPFFRSRQTPEREEPEAAQPHEARSFGVGTGVRKTAFAGGRQIRTVGPISGKNPLRGSGRALAMPRPCPSVRLQRVSQLLSLMSVTGEQRIGYCGGNQCSGPGGLPLSLSCWRSSGAPLQQSGRDNCQTCRISKTSPAIPVACTDQTCRKQLPGPFSHGRGTESSNPSLGMDRTPAKLPFLGCA